MSRTTNNEVWGPNDQHVEEREKSHTHWKLLGWFLAAMYAHGIVDPTGANPVFWSVQVVVMGWLLRMFVKGVREERIPIHWLLDTAEWLWEKLTILFIEIAPMALVERIARKQARSRRKEKSEPTPSDVRAKVRAYSLRHGGGAYLGTKPDGKWVTADRESAVMLLGPPRSGKTSAVIIPALLAAPGAAISTSTKPDVMAATLRARAELGQVWLFDPAGEQAQPDAGVRRLRWSPVAGAATWDQALVIARAMTAAAKPGAGTTNETHWTERAAALLAPLLYAANLTDKPIEDVLRWTLRQDLTPAREALGDADAEIASDVLAGIEKTDARERSSIYSAAAGVLAAYNADATRDTAKTPNFNPARFATSTDTIYITAPEHKQALCAPLIVGLLEQVRHAVYEAARSTPAGPPMLWALDEIANIAPIHDLPALVSQAGGQRLQVMIGLQDLSQARTRWGQAAADGFMSLFQTRLVLSGIADSHTLESISLTLGEYDRQLITTSKGTSESGDWFSLPGRSENVSRHTHRQRTLTPGEISRLPAGHGLLLNGGAWGLIRLTPWYCDPVWGSIAG
jgi:type IV secretory pathway TraG/TraD family ATPase VirD4